ncbi:hypothetical protein EDB85DRAFT_1886611 [Lactarius pseudohatsudake]|nr:hypothetical protein EDB85DRAFT_1886611 [Lactarius pseudohatsudake]
MVVTAASTTSTHEYSRSGKGILVLMRAFRHEYSSRDESYSKDPSKIQIGEIFCLLCHWKERQDQGIGPLMWVPTSPLFQNVEHPPRNKQHLRRARAQQSNASDQESFNLSNFGDSNPASSSTDEPSSDSSDSDPPHNRTSNGECETTEPSSKSSSSDESSDHAMATEPPPFHEPGEQSDPGSVGIPGSDGIPGTDRLPHSPGHNYQRDDRYLSPGSYSIHFPSTAT